MELLRQPHPSIPHNPLIAEPLYLARYIEKAGSGTLDMIARCGKAGLPEPTFEQRGGQFVTTLWRDWVTEERLVQIGLNDRQMKAVSHVKVHGRITNKDYQGLTGLTDRTVLRELRELLDKGIFEKIGDTGRGTFYVLKRKTRHKPDKPDKSFFAVETRHKPDKQDKGKR